MPSGPERGVRATLAGIAGPSRCMPEHESGNGIAILEAERATSAGSTAYARQDAFSVPFRAGRPFTIVLHLDARNRLVAKVDEQDDIRGFQSVDQGADVGRCTVRRVFLQEC